MACNNDNNTNNTAAVINIRILLLNDDNFLNTIFKHEIF